MEALPKVAEGRTGDRSHEQTVMNEAVAGLISFLSAHGSLVDKPRLMDWKELTPRWFGSGGEFSLGAFISTGAV